MLQFYPESSPQKMFIIPYIFHWPWTKYSLSAVYRFLELLCVAALLIWSLFYSAVCHVHLIIERSRALSEKFPQSWRGIVAKQSDWRRKLKQRWLIKVMSSSEPASRPGERRKANLMVAKCRLSGWRWFGREINRVFLWSRSEKEKAMITTINK